MKLEKYINETIVEFCQTVVNKAHAKGLVIGVSGGIDSAVVALIAKKAFPDNTICLIMPCDSDPNDLKFAMELVTKHNLQYQVFDLSATYQTMVAGLESMLTQAKTEKHKLTILGNLKARLRMCTLYAFAQINHYLVAGTDNADEWYTGYFTKYGDGGVDLLPIIHLLKQDVIAAAKVLAVPNMIIERTPTAGLWIGQDDETEMEFSYQQLDQYLLGNKKTLSPTVLARIESLHQISHHKRVSVPQAPHWNRHDN